jgi:hypothetical protein
MGRSCVTWPLARRTIMISWPHAGSSKRSPIRFIVIYVVIAAVFLPSWTPALDGNEQFAEGLSRASIQSRHRALAMARSGEGLEPGDIRYGSRFRRLCPDSGPEARGASDPGPHRAGYRTPPDLFQPAQHADCPYGFVPGRSVRRAARRGPEPRAAVRWLRLLSEYHGRRSDHPGGAPGHLFREHLPAVP